MERLRIWLTVFLWDFFFLGVLLFFYVFSFYFYFHLYFFGGSRFYKMGATGMWFVWRNVWECVCRVKFVWGVCKVGPLPLLGSSLALVGLCDLSLTMTSLVVSWEFPGMSSQCYVGQFD